MGGGLMQLVAYGAQDVYLSGNPQITFFKVVYRRHTNFSIEAIQQTWNGAGDFGRTVTCDINRNGDLITNMYVVVKLPAVAASGTLWGYVNRLGHALIDNVKIEIGGSKIDEQYGDWLNIWYELTHKIEQERGYNKMIGNVFELTNITSAAKPAHTLYIPLQFWFNRNNGLALPLIALQYHDVRITLTFRVFADCINYVQNVSTITPISMVDSFLLIDYIYLDSEERKRFAQASHEYLIEQLQFTGSESWSASNTKLRLNFNHPSKFLVWAPHLAIHNKRTRWAVWNNGTLSTKEITNRFAVIIATLFSRWFDYNTATRVIKVTNSAGATDLGKFVVANGLSADILKLLNKIDVGFVAGTASTELGQNVNVAGNDFDIFINAGVFIKNTLTIDDCSVTVDWLLSQIPAANLANNANKLLEVWTYNIINYHNYGFNIDGSGNTCSRAKLQLNGHDRFQERDGNYFNYVQPSQHFSSTPADGINVYSFALKAEDHQPTGTCNFSRIDNATLNVTSDYIIPYGSILNIYTQNYNVLRVMSGMAGTAYSN
jgi:hypothetical protein